MMNPVKEPKLAAAIVGRMTSARLPAKILTEVGGKPLLRFVVERLRHSGLDLEILIATSVDPSDDPVEAFAATEGLRCVRGPLEDVAKRFGMVLDEAGADAVFRVNGDSPLIDADLFRRAAEVYRAERPHLVTNIFPRMYPPGASVELIDATCYRRLLGGTLEAADREHVTRYFYQHPDEFRIVNLEPGRACDPVHLAIDTRDDMVRFKRMVEIMERPHWEYDLDEVVTLYHRAEETR